MAERDPREDIRAMFLACVWLTKAGISDDTRAAIEDLRPEITALLQFIAAKLAERNRSRGWFTEEDAPGYISRKFGDTSIRVPFHLFDDVPSDDVLEELLSFSAAIRTDGGVICLSGSSALHGALQHVGDCDFCEYLDAGTAPNVVTIAAEAVAALSNDVVFALSVTGWDGISNWEVMRPWPDPLLSEERARRSDGDGPLLCRY